MYIINYIKDIICPRKCYSCNKEGYFFCLDCLEKVDKFLPMCHVCKEKSKNFIIHKDCQIASNLSQVLIYGKYKNTFLKKLIHDGKYYGKKEVYLDLSLPLSQFFQEYHSIIDKENYIVIGTPMYFLRKWKRGYNQSYILGKNVAYHLGLPFYGDIVNKKKRTKPQSHLKRTERLTNLRKSLVVNSKYKDFLKGKVVIIVDDVVSTGSTLGEVSGILKLFGVKNIIGLVIASD